MGNKNAFEVSLNIKPENIRLMNPRILNTPAILCIIRSPSSKKADANLKEFFNLSHRIFLCNKQD